MNKTVSNRSRVSYNQSHLIILFAITVREYRTQCDQPTRAQRDHKPNGSSEREDWYQIRGRLHRNLLIKSERVQERN